MLTFNANLQAGLILLFSFLRFLEFGIEALDFFGALLTLLALHI